MRWIHQAPCGPDADRCSQSIICQGNAESYRRLPDVRDFNPSIRGFTWFSGSAPVSLPRCSLLVALRVEISQGKQGRTLPYCRSRPKVSPSSCHADRQQGTARICITGGTHGDFSRIEWFCQRFRPARDDVRIILGDAGFNDYSGKRDRLTLMLEPIAAF